MKEEGLFRVPGSAEQIKEISKKFEAGDHIQKRKTQKSSLLNIFFNKMVIVI